VWPAKGWPDHGGHIRVIVTPPLPLDCEIPQELNRLAQHQMDEALAELR
jgi:1-acyl-sn-glycerol-3-phosphate acyltransferase